MKYDVNSFSDVEVLTSSNDKDMSLDENSKTMIFQILSKGIYSNPIGSVVREITSNCFDSHVEAGVDLPVRIRLSLDKMTNTQYISFIDYGVGMSPERIDKIFSVYLSSTKRDTNNQIGQFGLGSKSPLAYKRYIGYGQGDYDNSYSVITNYNGIKYTYLIYEGNKSPRISEPIIENTNERNGTEVRIPVLDKDVEKFESEMLTQLYYFENIIFEGFDDSLTNDYQIVKTNNFLFRGHDYSNFIHACLGKVAYPIDYKVMGLDASDYNIPIALKLEIGDVNVTVSREAIDYSEKTIKLLKNKLLLVKAEIISLINKQYNNVNNLEDYFKVKNDSGELLMPNGDSISIKNIIKVKDITFDNFKYNFMTMPNDKELFKLFFGANVYGKKFTNNYYGSDDEKGIIGYNSIVKNDNIYYHEEIFQRKLVKQAWLKTQHKTRYIVISKNDMLDSSMVSTICRYFNMHDTILDFAGQPTDFMKSILELQEEYFDIIKTHCTDYDNVIVPDDFVVSYKSRNKISDDFRNSTMPIKIFNHSYSSNVRIKLDLLLKLNIPIYYGLQEDENKIYACRDRYKLLFNGDDVVSYNTCYNKFDLNKKRGILFIRISKANVHYMKFCKKAYHIDKFDSKMLHRKYDEVAEYYQVKKINEAYYNIDDLYKSDEFDIVSPEWSNKVKEIKKLVNKYKKINDSNPNWSGNLYKFNQIYKTDFENMKSSKEQTEILSMIKDVKKLEAINSETLKHIYIPRYLDRHDVCFWNILKKVMVL